MRPDVGFDACYRSSRGTLLNETFLLTGDVHAALSAVREAFVIAWQHWDRVTPLADPLEYVRPLAWRVALRHHRGRIWHRNKGITDQDKATLDALHRLPLTSRRLLLATEAAGLLLDKAAAVSGLTPETAQGQLEEARTQIATTLDVAPEIVGDRLREITYASSLTSNLPRPSIVMREGAKRRRVRAAVIVVGALALVLGAGAVVAEPNRDRPLADPAFLVSPSTTTATPTEDTSLTEDQMVSVNTVNAAVPDDTWEILRTDSNSAGDGLNSICQTTRYADPLGLGELVRVFATDGEKSTAVETLESSRTLHQARATYKVTLGWFGGCKAPRLRLAKAFRVDGVGDQATLLYLTQDLDQPTTQSVALAQIGTETVSLVFTTPPKRAPSPDDLLTALSTATKVMCDTSCTSIATALAPSYQPELPRVDSPRRLLAAIDLPPVARVQAVWVGTNPTPKMEPGATAECKTPGFASSGASSVQGRTFLMPQAGLHATFGAEETVGRFSTAPQAGAFAKKFTQALQSCATKDFTVTLTTYGKGHVGSATYQTWLIQSRLNRQSTLDVRVGVVRLLDTVAVVVFTPASGVDMKPTDFQQLTRRAASRL
jgi:DNA-directed RNA polymerase specialized sigma24 family protein